MTLNLLDPTRRLVIAHRGASAERPENTLPAFQLAVTQGCDAFELDVHLTRDGVPVLMHDPTLLRTCGTPERVADLTWDDIRTRDAGAGFTLPDGSRPFRGQGIHPPALSEVLRAFPDMPVLIELKEARAQLDVAEVLVEERAEDRCVLASFDDRALTVFRQAPFLVGASRRDIIRLYLAARLGRPVAPRCRCYAVPDRWKGWLEIPRADVVATARAAGAPVHVWTVDDPALARTLWARGVSGIISNRPGAVGRPPA